MAWDEWKKNSFARHAEVPTAVAYPRADVRVDRALDGIHGSTMLKRPRENHPDERGGSLKFCG